ncbi:unnamed protein product [Brassica rapa subsp. narinosa]
MSTIRFGFSISSKSSSCLMQRYFPIFRPIVSVDRRNKSLIRDHLQF